MSVSLEDQIMDVDRILLSKSIFIERGRLCHFIRHDSLTCDTLNGMDCQGCIGNIKLSKLTKIQPKLTKDNLLDTIKVHLVLES